MPEARLGRAFVNLADALVNGDEALDFLYLLCDRCRDVLVADAAGVMLTDEDGILQLSAASSEEPYVLALFEVQSHEGPCYDAVVMGQPVIEHDVKAAIDRWPIFAAKAVEAGFDAVYAFPLHLRDTRVGALNAFRHHSSSFQVRDMYAGRRWPTWRPSASSRTARSVRHTSVQSSCRSLSTAECSSSRPRACSPSAVPSTSVSRSRCCAATPATTASPSARCAVTSSKATPCSTERRSGYRSVVVPAHAARSGTGTAPVSRRAW